MASYWSLVLSAILVRASIHAVQHSSIHPNTRVSTNNRVLDVRFQSADECNTRCAETCCSAFSFNGCSQCELYYLEEDEDITSKLIGGFYDWTLYLLTCHEGFQLHDGKCYLFHSVGVTWSSAKEQCQQKCSKLASVETEAEDIFITNALKALEEPNICYFTSGNDIQVPGTWVWDSTGQQMGSYAPWYEGEGPQSGNYRRAHAYFIKIDFKWHDRIPTYPCGFICEK